MRFSKLATLVVPLAVAVLAACGDSATPGSGSPEPPLDFEATAEDFECVQNWERIRNLRVTNKLGFLEEAVALARDPRPGVQYPVGTIIQLFPGEAMVKRGPGFDPENNDWEYFELRVSAEGTSINVRGRDDVINMFGGQCFGCHAAARDFDFICEKGRGCVNLPVGDDVITALQEGDPRCK